MTYDSLTFEFMYMRRLKRRLQRLERASTVPVAVTATPAWRLHTAAPIPCTTPSYVAASSPATRILRPTMLAWV